MKTLLLTTALLGASALGASAQDLFRGEAAPDEIRASDFIGMRVYASEAAVDATDAAGPQEGWNDIGEINDLILARDGAVQAVLVDVGGFLGIGERQVAVNMDALRFVSDSATADNLSDYFLVINASRANLEDASEYAGGAMAGDTTAEDVGNATGAAAGVAAGTVAATDATADQAAAVAQASDEAAAAGTTPTDQAVTETADADAMTAEPAATETEMETDDTAAAAAGTMATGDAMATTDTAATAADARTPYSREGYAPMGADMMTAEALQGAAVYDVTDDRVGEVGQLLIDDSGQITDVVIDVGGFLGIGEKPVALPLSSLDILQQEGGDDLRVYVSQTREQLDAMDSYEAS